MYVFIQCTEGTKLSFFRELKKIHFNDGFLKTTEKGCCASGTIG